MRKISAKFKNLFGFAKKAFLSSSSFIIILLQIRGTDSRGFKYLFQKDMVKSEYSNPWNPSVRSLRNYPLRGKSLYTLKSYNKEISRYLITRAFRTGMCRAIGGPQRERSGFFVGTSADIHSGRYHRHYRASRSLAAPPFSI